MRIAITFQQRYAYDTHSVFPEITHRHYMVFEGETWGVARAKAQAVLGQDFAFDYEWEEFVPQIEKYNLIEFIHEENEDT